MTNWFYFLAIAITVIFIVCFVVIFFCALQIYYNVEVSLTRSTKKTRENKDE